ITNSYVQQYVFWLAVAFAILTIITLLVFLFYPKTIGNFLLKHDSSKKVIEYVQNSIQENLDGVTVKPTPVPFSVRLDRSTSGD
ncbi:Asp23/Gls24 family envelope stress response protein, partial [Enterococcus faecium]